MAKYTYGNTLIPNTTAKANDVKEEFQKVETMSAAEEIRTNDAIKFPVGEGNDIRIVDNAVARANKVLAFDASGGVVVKSAADAGLVTTAGDLAIVDTGDYFSGSDVEAALQELGARSQKNLFINGNFDIWQRGTSFTAGVYSADRWILDRVGSTLVSTREAFGVGQVDVPNNPKYFHRTVVTSVVGSSNYVNLWQKIEGVKSLQGLTATLSFWARTIGADKDLAIDVSQSFGTSGSPSSDVLVAGVKVTLTSDWTKFIVPIIIPSILGKSLGTDNNDTLNFRFWFDAGSTLDSRTDSLGQQSGTFDLAQVQLEKGSATDFELMNLGDILTQCQRYYSKSYKINTAPGAATLTGAKYSRYSGAVTSLIFPVTFPVKMRAVPTVTTYSLNGTINNASDTGGGFSHNSDKAVSSIQAVGEGGLGGIILSSAITSGNITGLQYTADAEL